MAAELHEVLTGRTKTYRLLSRIFRVEADQALLDELAGLDLSAEAPNEEIRRGYALWRRFLAQVDEKTLLDLARDYVKVFIGAGRNAQNAAYPYESVYTSPERILMQEARDEVYATFAEAGLAKSNSWKDPEDHVALELEFMAVLSDRAAAALAAGDEEGAADLLVQQKAFLHSHLLNWVPRCFKDDVIRFANTGLYRGLALITSGFLKADAEFLGEVVQDEAASEVSVA